MTASPVNLLLVDNEPDNLELLQEFLTGPGINLILASSGQQALSNIETMDFAAVVLDLHMPGLSGFELARSIRNCERSKSTPIIFVTGADPRAFPIEQAYALGAVDYLVKPVNPIILRAKVAVFVELYRNMERKHQEIEREHFLKEVQAANDRLADVFKQAPASMAVLKGSEHVFEMINDCYLALVGNRDQIGIPVRQALPELTGQGFFELLDAVFATGEPFVGVETPIALQRQPEGPVEVRSVDFVYTALQDISAQKDGESRERDLSAKLTATLESITNGFYLIDKDWNFAYLNGQAERMLLRSRHDLLGKNIWQAFPSTLGSPIEQEYRHAVETQCTAQFEIFYPPLDTWFDVHAYPTDEGLVVYFQNITQRRLAQGQLRLLQTAVSHLSDIVVITQVDAAPELEPKIVFVNDAFERRTGYCRDEVTGKSLKVLSGTLFESSDVGGVTAHEMWRPVQGEMLIHPRQADEFWIDVHVVALTDENGLLTHWVSVGRDITERRQAKQEILQLNSELEARVHHRTAQLEAANRELEAFSYSVSHDLRAPLNTIDGFSLLLQKAIGNQAGEKGQHYVRRIRAGVGQMGELINGLLSLAQLSRDTLQFSEVDLSAIARRVEQECRDRDPGRRVEVRIQDAMRIKGDARLLSVVMQNLLGNAWKFTARQEQAHIEIGSQAGTGDAIGETVYFIQDNGAGFDMAHAEKLFGTFERLHAPADFSGTGIGLATVKRVIERHAGRVWAQGQEGEGATFYFTLGACG